MGETLLQELCSMLDSYAGRDKIIKALCYTTKLVSAVQTEQGNDDLARRLALFSSEMAKTRANLRIFDDIATAQSAIDYGWGHKEPDQLTGRIGVLTNIFDHLYFETHTLCWLVQHGIINSKNRERWDKVNAVIWSTSIFLNLMKTLRMVHVMRLQRHNIDENENKSSVAFKKLEEKEQMEVLSIVRLTLDFVHASSTLPAGWLWGGKISTLATGIIGTTSSCIGIYQFIAKKRLAKN